MKRMKALLAMLAVALATLSPITSFTKAVEDDSSLATVQSGTMELKKKFEGGYKILIPQSINDLKAGYTFEAGATDIVISPEQELNISVTSKYDWRLVNTADDKKQLKYEVTTPDGTVLKEGENQIYTIRSAGKKDAVTLTVQSVEEPEYAGEYTDILTFKAELVTKGREETPSTDSTPEETTTTISAETPSDETTTTTTVVSSDDGGDKNDNNDNGET